MTKNSLPVKPKELFINTLVIAAVIMGVKYYYKSQKPQDPPTKSLYSDLGGDFHLKTNKGEFTLQNLKGKPSVLYFGFTSCPDICPLSLSRLTKAIDKIDKDIHNKINKVFISVDYKRDTPEKVQEYANYFGNFIGATGSKEEIEAMTKKYAVHFEFVEMKDSAMKYTVDHTSRFYLLNSKGELVNSYSDLENDPAFSNDLKTLLK